MARGQEREEAVGKEFSKDIIINIILRKQEKFGENISFPQEND